MKLLNKDELNGTLSLLGKRLELDDSPPVNIVVCGGSSLIVTGLVSREATKDVDVLALFEETEKGRKIIQSRPLPKFLVDAAKMVAADMGLDENWLNDGPSDLVKYALPDGLEGRLKTVRYGKRLTVNFASRYDQIHLKIYAAVDSGPGRHVQDLLELKPSENEMEAAARWAIKQDSSDGFKTTLKEMLRKLNYGKVVERI